MNPRERAVVARLNTGLVIRGTVNDFTPERPSFRVTQDGGGRGVEVKLKDLKALFFPRVDPPVEPERRRPPRYGQPDPVTDGKRIVVFFNDGECMTGHTLSYRPEKVGFFLFPDDPGSQHEKVFIYSGVVTSVLTGREAEEHPTAIRRQRREAA
jgi:hypothetical protein